MKYLPLLLLFLSCHKSPDYPATDPPGDATIYNTQLLLGKWVVTNKVSDAPYDFNGDGLIETDIYLTWTDCQKDNWYLFLEDHHGQFRWQCNVQAKSIGWNLIDKGKTIVFNFSGAEVKEKIIELGNGKLITTQSLQPPGGWFTITTTYMKI